MYILFRLDLRGQIRKKFVVNLYFLVLSIGIGIDSTKIALIENRIESIRID
jgi:hypothetical protein